MSNEPDQIETRVVFTDAEEDISGNTMECIYRGLSPWELLNLPDIQFSAMHTVLFHQSSNADTSIPPRPFRGHDKWDAQHVRLPCSPKNQYPIENSDGTEDIKDRWTLICHALERDIRTSYELEAAILTYNTKYSRTWKFRALHKLCADMDTDGKDRFFQHILPGIIRLALQLPELFGFIPLLKAGRSSLLSFSQQQVASLLANAFLCTFPRRNTQKRNSEYRTFPDINFNRLFQTADGVVLEKLKCILHYFQRVCARMPNGVITVARRCWTNAEPSSDHCIDWAQCKANFQKVRLHVSSTGTIEDQGVGLLQVDFANKYLGGGVLGRGCVQEEIRFVICPELFVTKLVAEKMQPREAIFVVGAERFSDYAGYASSFTFAGEFIDETPSDSSRRRMTTIVAIDALNFQNASDQYREEPMSRELNKAFVGFAPWLHSKPAPGVATGNWGCGAFGGDSRLKALLQLMVCCVARRPLVYFTFGDQLLKKDLLKLYNWLRREDISIAQLWSYLKQFRKQRLTPDQLYAFLYQEHRDRKMEKPKIVQSKLLLDETYDATVHIPEISTAARTLSQTPPTNPSSSYESHNLPITSSQVDQMKPDSRTTFSLLSCLDQVYTAQNGNETTRLKNITESSLDESYNVGETSSAIPPSTTTHLSSTVNVNNGRKTNVFSLHQRQAKLTDFLTHT